MKVKRKADKWYQPFSSVNIGDVVEFKANPDNLFVRVPPCILHNTNQAKPYNVVGTSGYFSCARDSDLCMVVKCTLVED